MTLKRKYKKHNPNWPKIPNYPCKILVIEDVWTKHFNDSRAFIKYADDLDDIFKNIKQYNPNKKHKTLIVIQ